MIRAYFRRGAHRANRFSVRVADIVERLERERQRGMFSVWVDGKEYLKWRGTVYLPSVRVDSKYFLMVTPPTSGVALPALIEDQVVADA